MSPVWSESEVRVVVDSYMEMLGCELRGEKYIKKNYIRETVARLGRRTRGSIERKWQNVSAVLRSYGWPDIPGYKPLGHVQQLLADQVAARLDALDVRDIEQACAPPQAEVDPQGIREASPPVGSTDPPDWVHPAWSPHRRPIRIDYLEAEDRNRALGKAGERAIVLWEQGRLVRANRPDLASRVEWVAESRGDGLGYDIESFNPDGSARWIEVKTTNFGKHMPFLATRNEVECSDAEPQRYQLYRLFEFRSSPQLYILQGSLRELCRLSPQNYLARAV